MAVPRVSAVIPVYQGEPYIRRAIRSLLAQTFADIEVVVVDDGSTDATGTVVDELARGDDRVHPYHCAHRGAIGSFNFGAQQACGEYIAWLGADDVALPDRLTAQVALLDSQPQVAVMGGGVTATDAQLRPVMTVRYPTDDAGIRALLPTSNPIAAPAALMRAEAYRQLGGVRPAFSGGAEDYDLWLRMADRYQLANLHNPVVLYRVHTGQVSQTRSIQMILSMVAAQVAARRRQAGQSDGLDGRTGLDYEVLWELEPDIRLLNDSLLMTAAVHATFMAIVGSPRGALDLLAWAEITGHGSKFSRNALARAALARGIAAWRQHDFPVVVSSGLAAITSNPIYVGLMLARVLHSKAGVLAHQGNARSASREAAVRVSEEQ